MLQNTTELYGHKLVATDGDIGHLKDFYFDDTTWAIRYLVADTGTWLTGRPVLIARHALAVLDSHENTLHIKLRKQQIQNSTTDSANKLLSGEDEVGCCRYYGWPAHWESGARKDLPDPSEIQPSSSARTESRVPYRHLGDKHLQSTQSITDYLIQTPDGVIGSVSGCIVDNQSWMVRELIVETGHWLSGKEIRIPTAQIKQIKCEYSSVMVDLSKEDIRRSTDKAVGPGHQAA